MLTNLNTLYNVLLKIFMIVIEFVFIHITGMTTTESSYYVVQAVLMMMIALMCTHTFLHPVTKALVMMLRDFIVFMLR